MVTVDEVARETLNAVGSNAGIIQAIRWASQRYRQLAQRGKMRHLRVVGEVVIPAAIGAEDGQGTITATRDSQIVTGDSDAQTTWRGVADPDQQGRSGLAGRYFRYRRDWYRIEDLEDDSAGGVQLRLTSPIAEESSTDVTYKIVQKHTRMPANMQSIAPVMVQMRLWRPLAAVSISELELTQPERLFVAGTGPEMWAEVGNDENGVRLVEFYPYPLKSELIRFVYYTRAPELNPGDPIPNDISIEVIKAGVLVDVYRWEMSQAARENRVDAAALWRNEARAQETTWQKRMEEAMAAERANDDISFILHTMGPPAFGDFTFIRTARQDAISRLGNFP